MKYKGFSLSGGEFIAEASSKEEFFTMLEKFDWDWACASGNQPSHSSLEQIEEFYEILNLTPHTVNICDGLGRVIESYPSQGSARVATTFEQVGVLNGVPVLKTTYGETECLPAEQEGVAYIVSMVVKQANPTRTDLFMPNTAPGFVVRDEAGQIVGVKSFAI